MRENCIRWLPFSEILNAPLLTSDLCQVEGAQKTRKIPTFGDYWCSGKKTWLLRILKEDMKLGGIIMMENDSFS